MVRRRLYGHAYRANNVTDRLRARVRTRLGIAGPPVLLPYRGFGTPTRALVRGRVLEDRDLQLDDRSTLHRIAVAYRRYATFEIVQEPVRFEWGDQVYFGASDDEGYVDLWVEPPPSVRPGENHLLGTLPESPGDAVPLTVFIVAPQADFGVISDIDDTVIETGATHLLKRAHALFWAQAKHRIPFDGVAGFYRALSRGPTGGGHNPIFYLSSSPWNLHEHLVELLDLHEIPQGPLLLRDWGFGPEGFAPNGKHAHKVAKADEILRTFPDLPFVLVGDSGQEDAHHYGTLVERHRGRVLAVYLRDVGRHKSDFPAAVERIRALGVPVLVAKTTLETAHHAVDLGLIPYDALETVERQTRRDQEPANPLERPIEA